jgi:hypothetical protein
MVMARNRLGVSVLTFGLVCVLSSTLIGQSSPTLPDDVGFRPFRFDSAHQIVYFGTCVLQKTSKPIRSFGIDGIEHGAAIDIFKDFPNVDHIVVDDLASSPGGKTVIAAILNFGSRKLKHVLLTYSSSGTLLDVWDTEPYYHEGIATDDDGNVFALGVRLDERKNIKPPYPLLVEYSPTGQVLHETLSSALFKNGSASIEGSDGAPFNPVLVVHNDHLLIYAPTETEFLVCTKEGAIINRFSVAPVLRDITEMTQIKSVDVRNVVLLDENRLALDLTGNVDDKRPAIPSTVAVNVRNGESKLIIKQTLRTWLAFGGHDDNVFVLSNDSPHSPVLIRSYEMPF